jgi:hypothetical protein
VVPTSEYIRSSDDHFYVCPFDVDHLESLPWGDQLFDVFLVALEDADASEDTKRAIAELVKLNNDWIETFGVAAEELHDRIDEASVACGRQSAVGDGNPMTAWHDDLTSSYQVIDYIRRGGHGSCDYKLVAIVGTDRVSSFLRELKERLPAPIGEVR